MMKPMMQIDNEVREMTDDEYQLLLSVGWTPGDEPTEEPAEETPVEEPATEEPAPDPE